VDLVQDILRGERRSVARAISLVEGQKPSAPQLLTALYPHTGRAHLIGVTGSPGTGKSTLVNQLALAFRRQEKQVGIIAVDPSSPFSGGALLGDRIRMRDLAGDPGIFMRSMATRGAMGGLSAATFDAVQVLDAAGYDVILIETVGVGQDEVEIARTAHTVIVIQVPGLGDDIQAIKAGLMEIADLFVVNKADREGADQAARTLEMMIELDGPRAQEWQIPVCKTVALDGTGVSDLIFCIQKHHSYLLDSGMLQDKERQRTQTWLHRALQQTLLMQFLERLESDALQTMLDRIVARKVAPYAALRELLDGVQASGQ